MNNGKVLRLGPCKHYLLEHIAGIDHANETGLKQAKLLYHFQSALLIAGFSGTQCSAHGL